MSQYGSQRVRGTRSRTSDPQGYETWQAIHDGCDCGRCCHIEVEWTDEQYELVERAANDVGISVSAFVHMALVEALDREDMYNRRYL